MVDEIYHPGYAAKRMEIGAVIAAAPAENVRREVPAPGDIVILLGGSDGPRRLRRCDRLVKIAHALNRSKAAARRFRRATRPRRESSRDCSETQKRCLMIKRCNDFGAGGVSVAIGELADGLEIDLNAVPKKYEGLDGTELAIT